MKNGVASLKKWGTLYYDFCIQKSYFVVEGFFKRREDKRKNSTKNLIFKHKSYLGTSGMRCEKIF